MRYAGGPVEYKVLLRGDKQLDYELVQKVRRWYGDTQLALSWRATSAITKEFSGENITAQQAEIGHKHHWSLLQGQGAWLTH